MNFSRKPNISQEESEILSSVSIRLAGDSERNQYDALLEEKHYLHNAHLVGEQLRYVAEYKGQWVGLLSWSAGSFNLKDREAWIGWDHKQKRRRLALVVNNSRFLILDTFRIPNLASRVMGLCLSRLSADWLAAYGHEVLVAESFVDDQLFKGTCYRASGWTLLGKTQGYGRSRQDFYNAHDRPKQLWVRELRSGARTILRGKNLPVALKYKEPRSAPDCPVDAATLKEMRGYFGALPEFRKRDGLYELGTLVTIAVCATLCGVVHGQRDLAAFAANMTKKQWESLALPRRGNPRKYSIPKETTFHRLLTHLDSRALEKALLAWQNHVLGPPDKEDDQVALDGKALRGSRGCQVISAVNVKSGRWLGSELVETKSNEIPAGQDLLKRVPLENKLVLVDAMHTQRETARLITQERGGDYLFTVKENQKTTQESIRMIHGNLKNAFSPS